MKVVLLQDVKGVGKKGQVVEVSDGYGANFIIPRKLGVLATKKSVEIRDQQVVDAKNLEAQKRQEAEVLKEKLKDVIVEFACKTGKDGKMFGSISSKQIAEELKSKHGIEIDKRKFIDQTTASNVGYTILKIELFKNVVGEIKVHIKEMK